MMWIVFEMMRKEGRERGGGDDAMCDGIREGEDVREDDRMR
jgi:hypothetical protein